MLEIPYAYDSAPEVTVELKCNYTESDTEFSRESIVWSDSLRVAAWEPAGGRRSRTVVRFELPEGSRSRNYSWTLAATSETAGVPLVASFLVPLEFATERD